MKKRERIKSISKQQLGLGVFLLILVFNDVSVLCRLVQVLDHLKFLLVDFTAIVTVADPLDCVQTAFPIIRCDRQLLNIKIGRVIVVRHRIAELFEKGLCHLYVPEKGYLPFHHEASIQFEIGNELGNLFPKETIVNTR
jgi:hypothetical protein